MHKFLAETRPGSKVIGLGNFFPLTFFFWGGVKTKGKKRLPRMITFNPGLVSAKNLGQKCSS